MSMEDILKADSPFREKIKKHEGWSSRIYYCSEGYCTVGYGHNLTANSLPPEIIKKYGHEFILAKGGISLPQGEELLTFDMEKTLRSLDLILGFHNFLDWKLNRQLAIFDMCFQLGFLGLYKFKKMLEAIKSGDWESAAKEIQFNGEKETLYYQQVPERAQENIHLILN